MKRFFISALALLGMGTMANAQFYVYDKDGKVLYQMKEGTPAYIEFEAPTNPYLGTENGHDWVDLGLTSGTLWATCNVGADVPESYGDYFAWGETEPHYSAGGNTDSPTWKDGYSAGYNWSTYKYMDHNKDSWEGCTKYTFADGQTSGVWYDSEGQFIGDNKTELEDADDVAVQTWGGAWRMPTKTQQDELRNECDWEWTSINGVNGYKVKSRVNSNFIFLPAAGYRWDTDLRSAGNYGYYWSRSLGANYSGNAYNLGFYSYRVGWSRYDRYLGFSVRPVCLPAAE